MKQPTALALVKRARRRALLESLIAALQDRGQLTNTEIRRALTKPEWEAYRAQQRPRSIRNIESGLAADLKRYAALISKADKLYHSVKVKKNNRIEPRFMPRKFLPVLNTAESVYEKALEQLQEIVDLQPGALAFLDRPVVFGMHDGPSLDPHSVPRLISSRSQYAAHRTLRTDEPSRADKLYALQNSLSELSGAVQVTKLKPFSALDFDDDF